MNMKKIHTMMLAAVVIVLSACGGNANKSSESTGAATASTDDHQHRYACPMHPEVTGKEGDTCPKCGMPLEHSDEMPGASGTYYMQFTATPQTVQPNQEVTLSFVPRKKEDSTAQVALDIEHEKKIHLILVSDDLSWFDHIHPEYGADGKYSVATKFPAPGVYKAFADYKPTGGNHTVDKIEIKVAGNVAAARKFEGDKLQGSSDAYSFELRSNGSIQSGKGVSMQGIIKKDGKEMDANLLENYLGAKAHFVVISLNEKEYLHVHPSVKDGRFDLQTTFEKPGIYRGWVQFNAEGKLHTIDFTMNVK